MKRRMTRRGVVYCFAIGGVAWLVAPRVVDAVSGKSLTERMLWYVLVGIGIGLCFGLAGRLLGHWRQPADAELPGGS